MHRILYEGFFVNTGEMSFALTPPPIAKRVWDSAETTTQLKLLDVFHRALFPKEKPLNPLLSQNYQVHTRWRSRYFPFLPFERQSRFVNIVPAFSRESASVREREMPGVANPMNISYVFLSHHSPAFSPCVTKSLTVK